MKKHGITLLTVLFALVLFLSANCTLTAKAATANALTYKINDGKVTITDCHTSATGELVIPDTINGYPVTSIGEDAFYQCSSLTSVTIPDSVTSIGSRAFCACYSLTSVTIPDSVTSIEGMAFQSCTGLTSVTIGDSVTSIGNSAFRNCARLTSVTIPDNVTSIGSYAFDDCASLTSVTIGDGVTSIGSGAFYLCDRLTSVTIPDSVTDLGDKAFYYCDRLTSVTIGDGVTSIGDEAFYQCDRLTSVIIGDSVTSIGSGAFNRCSNLTDVYIADIYAWWITNCDYDASTLMHYADNLHILDESGAEVTELVIDSSVTQIPDKAFYKCTGLTTVTIPDSVTSIGENAFSYCDSLTSVTIGNSVTSIGNYAFNGCSRLTSVTIPDSVTSIGSSAFYNCSKLTDVYITDIYAWWGIVCDYSYIPMDCADNFHILDESGTEVTELVIDSSVTRIPDKAFYKCTGLTTVEIPDGVTSIDDYAFFGCQSLTSVAIGSGVISIGNSAFSSCTSLINICVDRNNKYYSSDNRGVLYNKDKTTLIRAPWAISGSYIILDSATVIGDMAFSNCTGLTSVTIGDSVTSIGSCAFEDCSSLTSVHITDLSAWCQISFAEDCYSNPLYYSSNLYLNDELVKELEIPDGVTKIEDRAFSSYSNLTSVTIPESVQIIGDGAFEDCPNLTNVYYAGRESLWDNIYIGDYNGDLINASIHYNHTHDYSQVDPVTVAATCTEAGYIEYTCVHGETYREIIQPLGHSVVDLPVVEPTCTKNGHTAHTQCSLCKEYFVEPTIYPALGHSYGKWTVTKEATATAQGSKRRDCTRCDAFETAVIPKLPVIKTQPANKYLPAGKTAKFTVKASGTGLKYQWQYRSSSKGSWKTASGTGSKTASLSVAATAAQNGYQYRCQITDKYGNVIYSNAATLKIVTLKVTTQPANKYLPAGKTAKFTVKASGTGLKYQWQYRTSSKGSWKTVSGTGSKTATLSVSAAASRNGYQYRCQITDKYGNVIYSNTATLKIVTLKITTQPSSVTLAKGKTATFKVVAKGTGLKYQWQYRKNTKGAWKKATNTGNKTATLKVPVTAAKNGYQYRCVITDKYGNVINSKAATLKVK